MGTSKIILLKKSNLCSTNDCFPLYLHFNVKRGGDVNIQGKNIMCRVRVNCTSTFLSASFHRERWCCNYEGAAPGLVDGNQHTVDVGPEIWRFEVANLLVAIYILHTHACF